MNEVGVSDGKGRVEPFCLADAVVFQEGSIVSRALIDKDVGAVTVFAFEAGQGLSEHTAPYDALVFLLEGSAEVSVEGRVFCLRSGDAVFLPANEPHALRAVERFKMVLIMVKS